MEKKKTAHVVAQENACVVGAANASAFVVPPPGLAFAWKALEIVDAVFNDARGGVVEDIAVGRPVL